MRFMDSGPDAGGFGNESDDDAIPIIPDLDDVRDEDMQLQVNGETRYRNSVKPYLSDPKFI